MINVEVLAEAINAQYPQDERAALCMAVRGAVWKVAIIRYKDAGGSGFVECVGAGSSMGRAMKALVKAWMPGRVELQRLFDQCA